MKMLLIAVLSFASIASFADVDCEIILDKLTSDKEIVFAESIDSDEGHFIGDIKIKKTEYLFKADIDEDSGLSFTLADPKVGVVLAGKNLNFVADEVLEVYGFIKGKTVDLNCEKY